MTPVWHDDVGRVSMFQEHQIYWVIVGEDGMIAVVLDVIDSMVIELLHICG